MRADAILLTEATVRLHKGHKVGKYVIQGEIGRGGMAVVYKAYDPHLERHVALKVLHPELAINREFVQRFIQEARAAAALDHPNIVTIYDVGHEGDLRYIAMAYISPGQTVKDVIIAQGTLPPRRVIHIIRQLAAALDYAHSKGMIHRDVKPGNVLLDLDDRTILSDFGIVHAAALTRLTRAGTIIGTVQYMSPEQAKGEKIDARSDIYSLGIVAYEMLSGRVPFMAETDAAILHAHVYEEPPSLRAFAPGLPAAADRVIRQALAKSPGQRYRSATAFARALEVALAEEATMLAPPRPVGRPTGRSSATMWVLLGGSGVLLFALLLIMTRTPDPPPPPTPLPPPTGTRRVVMAVTETPTVTPEPTRTEIPLTATPAPTRTRTPTGIPTPTKTRTVPPATPTPVRPYVLVLEDTLLSESSGSSATVGPVYGGEQVRIWDSEYWGTALWYRVCCTGESLGWIKAEALGAVRQPTGETTTPLPTRMVRTVSVVVSRANTREGPGTHYDRIESVRKGDKLKVWGRDRSKTWCFVTLPNGEYAWIDKEMVSLGSADMHSLPEAKSDVLELR